VSGIGDAEAIDTMLIPGKVARQSDLMSLGVPEEETTRTAFVREYGYPLDVRSFEDPPQGALEGRQSASRNNGLSNCRRSRQPPGRRSRCLLQQTASQSTARSIVVDAASASASFSSASRYFRIGASRDSMNAHRSSRLIRANRSSELSSGAASRGRP
jgi:hypothetical protein